MNLKKASRQRGVCVDHLKRCKTSYSFDLVQFYFVLAGGQSHVCSWLPNEEGCIHDWYDSGTLESRTCYFNLVVNGDRLSQEPASRFRFSIASGPSSEPRCQQVSIQCTVFAIWFTADFVRWNSCFLQGQRKNSSTMVFSPSHPIFLSDFKGLFVHARCTPQQ